MYTNTYQYLPILTIYLPYLFIIDLDINNMNCSQCVVNEICNKLSYTNCIIHINACVVVVDVVLGAQLTVSRQKPP